MPKFARPTSYTGSKSNKDHTGDTRAATIIETLAGEAEDLYVSPATLQSALDEFIPLYPVAEVDDTQSPYDVLPTDYLIAVNTAGGAVTINLPDATTVSGQQFLIKDVGGNAVIDNITIDGGGTNLLGVGTSSGTKTIAAAYAGATVISDGSNWDYYYTA
jgi:hypothetical protein